MLSLSTVLNRGITQSIRMNAKSKFVTIAKCVAIDDFQENVILIRNGLNIREQMELFEACHQEQQFELDELKKYEGSDCKIATDNAHDTSLMFSKQIIGDIKNECKDSMYSTFLNKAETLVPGSCALNNIDFTQCKLCHIQAIKYVSPTAKLKYHIDGYHKANIAFLFSIGCTANFYVFGPKMKEGKVFEFNSGDILIFDASTSEQIVHGIESICDASSCPQELRSKNQTLSENRIGVQIRYYK